MNEVYESLKEYYDEHGEVMPDSQFANFIGEYSQQEVIVALMQFNKYLDNLHSEVISSGKV